MREMKDSGVEWIGEIPKYWVVTKLNRAVGVITDYVASGSFADLAENVTYLDNPNYAMLIRVADLSGTKDKPVYIDKKAYDFLSNSNLFGGEVILSNIGSVGSVYIYHKMYEYASLAPNSIMLNKSDDNRFVYYWFMNPMANDELKRIGGNAVQAKFNKTQLRQFKIALPPSEEQHRIADYLDQKCNQIDTIIEKKQLIIEKLGQYRLSVISEMMVDSAYPLVSLGKCIDKMEQGWSPSPSEKNQESDWHVLSLAAVKEGRFNKTEIKLFSGDKSRCERLKVNKGDFLLTRSNTREYVGAVCLVDDVFENTIFSDLIYRIIFNTRFLLPSFALYYFQSAYARQQIERDAHGSSSTMVKITHKDISNWKISLPSIEQQKIISKRLHTLDIAVMNEMDKRILEINKLIAYKKSLIYEVVTGKKTYIYEKIGDMGHE